MSDAVTIFAVLGTFLLAGTVKGVIGLGLPTVSLALLTATIGLPQAMALLLVPSLVTNLWQALSGGNFKPILSRTWPFMTMATITVWVGALALTRADAAHLSALLGAVLVAYAAINLGGLKVALPARQEYWLGPAFGAANGVLTGMTGSFVVPGVMFLQAIGLPRDMLVQAMGLLFMLSTLALAAALGGSGLLDAELGLMSLLALAPAMAGMVAGQQIRHRLSEAAFRTTLFCGLIALGLYLIADNL